MRKITCLLLSFVLCIMMAGCRSKNSGSVTTASADHIKCEMKITDYGIIKLELYPEKAPITVNNFVSLVKSGFYDGLKIHRVQPGFVIQGGDPTIAGKDEVAAIKGEFRENGIENDLAHTRGALSMARKGNDNNSASSQFFVCVGDCRSSLDGKYAGFGYVTEGMDVVDKICALCPGQGSMGFIENPDVMPVIEYVKVVE